jgi:hypothetical protein
MKSTAILSLFLLTSAITLAQSSLYVIDDTLTETTTQNSEKAILIKFCNAGLKELIFSRFTFNCQTGYFHHLAYRNSNQQFRVYQDSLYDTNYVSKPPGSAESIDSSIVNDFLKKLPSLLNIEPDINEFEFTQQEYEQCREDILFYKANLKKIRRKKIVPNFDFKSKDIDFERLLSTVDSIKHINPKRLLNTLYRIESAYRTTLNDVTLLLVNKVQDTMKMKNYSVGFNTFLVPWLITINKNNYAGISYSMGINKFIHQFYPSLLKPKDRQEVLHYLVKELYESI